MQLYSRISFVQECGVDQVSLREAKNFRHIDIAVAHARNSRHLEFDKQLEQQCASVLEGTNNVWKVGST